jgi:thioredoxin-related protein
LSKENVLPFECLRLPAKGSRLVQVCIAALLVAFAGFTRAGVEAAEIVIEKTGGRIVEMKNLDDQNRSYRYLRFILDGHRIQIDPNRIFSAEGITRYLDVNNEPNLEPELKKNALAALTAFAEPPPQKKDCLSPLRALITLHASTMKKLLLLLTLITASLHAEAPKWGFDVSKAILQAGKENKMTFILMGRENCGNCQATKKLVNESKVPVTPESFVVADIDVDNQKARAEFDRKFKKEQFGNTLPFVVITDSKGKALASFSGFKNAADLTKMIEEAKTKTAAAPKK